MKSRTKDFQHHGIPIDGSRKDVDLGEGTTRIDQSIEIIVDLRFVKVYT